MPKGLDLLNKITSIRRQQAETVRYILEKDELLGQKMAWCGTWLHLREWIDHGGETRLINANFCKKHLICRTCAARRSVRLVEAYAGKVATVMQAEPGLVPAMVTLTLKNGPNLSERLEHGKKAWRAMQTAKRKGASESGRHLAVQWNRVAGCIKAVEIKPGVGGWHPHLHCFTLLSEYIDQRKLSEEWQRFTGDSMIVDVRKCYGEPLAALFEVVKYVTKFGEDMSNEMLWDVYQTCQGSRFIDPQGCLRGVPEPDIDADNTNGLSGPTIDYIARWLAWEQKFAVEKIHAAPVNNIRQPSGGILT